MDESPREHLLQTQPLGIPKEVIKHASDPQAWLMNAMTEEKRERFDTNAVLFKKLDEVIGEVRNAASCASEAKNLASEVKDQFIILNGSVKDSKKRLTSLEYRNELADTVEAEKALVAKGVEQGSLIIPNRVRFFWKWFVYIFGGMFAAIGSLATAWPFIVKLAHYWK